MATPSFSKSSLLHPLALNSSRHWRTLRRESGGIEPAFRKKAALISLISPLWSPLRFAENLLYGDAVSRTAIEPQPLFVLGHWRTGTTHLHNVLSQDPQFSFVSTFHTILPGAFLLGRGPIQPLLAAAMPEKRPMDNVRMGPELPQEEEMAMCNITPYSFYVGWYFPRRMPELFRRYVLFEDTDPREVQAWQQAYQTLLRKAMYLNPGRRLVLKSPTNTGRIPQLLELFPDAKFIHIHRDPYRVYKSTVLLHQRVFESVALQSISREEIERNVLDFFKRLTEKYYADRDLIPKGNLVEIAYEDLVADGMGTLESIYAALGFPHWPEAAPHFKTYLDSQAGYEGNVFRMDQPTIDRIESAWGALIERWGYARPQVV